MEKTDFSLGLQFAGFGVFSSVYQPADESRNPQFRFDYIGGQFGVEVDPSELAALPGVGDCFAVKGRVRLNTYNSSVSLLPESKIKVPELTAEQYVQGLRIYGLGIVGQKNLSTMGRQTFLKAVIKWQGGQYVFSQLAPEIYQKVPAAGQAVKFECGLVPYNERNQTGQNITLQKLQLLKVQFEQLSFGASPSGVSSGTRPASDTLGSGRKAG